MSGIRRERQCETNAIVVVTHETCKARVFLNKGPFSRTDMHLVDIVKTGVAVVDTHEDFFGGSGTHTLDAGCDLLEGGQIHYFFRIHIDPVDVPVFIAVRIL